MTETFATGGLIPMGSEPIFLAEKGCDYVIPRAMGWKWAALVKELNDRLDKSDEDVLD